MVKRGPGRAGVAVPSVEHGLGALRPRGVVATVHCHNCHLRSLCVRRRSLTRRHKTSQSTNRRREKSSLSRILSPSFTLPEAVLPLASYLFYRKLLYRYSVSLKRLFSSPPFLDSTAFLFRAVVWKEHKCHLEQRLNCTKSLAN